MRTLCLLCIAAICSACSYTPQPPTIEQQAAKLLITGVRGTSLSETNEIRKDIESGIAGVILFENNIAKPDVDAAPRSTLTKFIAEMKALRSTPLLVAIDQEGGFVNRLKPKYGFKAMPSQRSVGEVGTEKHAREVSSTIARELMSVGVNLNFSPCVDVEINPECPVIGRFERSFSSDENVVSRLAQIYIEEHHKQGVLTSIKHFPGHGSSLTDSHLGLTDITDTWHEEQELRPYRDIINSSSCDMVMVSHLFNRNIDSDYPATLSRKTIDSLLRGVLRWDGVIVTDDMQMRAIVDHYGFEEAVTLAINAGVDLFIVGGNIRQEEFSVRERFVEVIKNGVKSGSIAHERVEEAARRVENLLQSL